MDTDSIIQKYYSKGSTGYDILVEHSTHVSEKAVAIARKVPHLNPDPEFIRDAAMLHDIGIYQTHAPYLECYGQHPYIFHGILGRTILENEGYPSHALVCERHTGAGISVDDIRGQNLGLPARDMCPVSIDEQIICYADKFFSKNPGAIGREKTMDEVISMMSSFGNSHVETFKKWAVLFGD